MKNSPLKQKIILKVNGVKYKRHPISDMYGASIDGKIINVKKQKPMSGNISNIGYLQCGIRRLNNVKPKTTYGHQFISLFKKSHSYDFRHIKPLNNTGIWQNISQTTGILVNNCGEETLTRLFLVNINMICTVPKD